MIGFLQRVLADLQAVWQDPRADPRRTVVFLGAGILVVLILVVVLLMLVAGGPKRPKGVRRRLRDRVRGGYFALGAVVLLAGLLLVGDEFATAPSTCARCHEIRASIATHKLSSHKSTDCMGCHGGDGLTGFVTTRVSAAGNLVARVLRVKPSLSTTVPNAQCLDCHGEVREGTRQRLGIRVRHSDFVDAGAPCLSCHGDVGHGPNAGFTRQPTMDKCIGCHNGTTAPAECSVCHEADVAEARDIPDSYPKAHLAEKRTCEGCHSLEPCRECHGLQMPHPVDFATPQQHAPLAAFGGKEKVCYRCHDPNECRRCHQSFDSHGPGWITQHSLGGPAASDHCKSCHSQTPVDVYCDLCHAP